MPQVPVWISVSELQEKERAGERLWGTPGEGEPYWAKEPRFPIDEGLAEPEDFLSANGYTAMTQVPADHVLGFMVEMPAPPIG